MEVDESRLRRDRVLFYAGLVMLLVGLPGLALGSSFHDIFRLNLVGQAYSEWGWINQTSLYLGIAVSVVGAVLLAISFRGGIVEGPPKAKSEGDAE